MRKIYVRYEKYDRQGGGIREVIYKSRNIDKIWKTIAEKHSYGVDNESETTREIKMQIEDLNGDGCDYILEVKDMETGEVLLKGYNNDIEIETINLD